MKKWTRNSSSHARRYDAAARRTSSDQMAERTVQVEIKRQASPNAEAYMGEVRIPWRRG
jgi:hypothetical protein